MRLKKKHIQTLKYSLFFTIFLQDFWCVCLWSGEFVIFLARKLKTFCAQQKIFSGFLTSNLYIFSLLCHTTTCCSANNSSTLSASLSCNLLFPFSFHYIGNLCEISSRSWGNKTHTVDGSHQHQHHYCRTSSWWQVIFHSFKVKLNRLIIL